MKLMLKKTGPFFICLAILCQFQGCASIFSSGSQTLIVSASGDEENIAVEIQTPSGSYKSKLPTTIVTSPSSFNQTEIMIKDKCYENSTIQAGKSVTPAFWANFLWVAWFPVGMGVDFLTGNMWKMDSQVMVPLNKIPSCK